MTCRGRCSPFSADRSHLNEIQTGNRRAESPRRGARGVVPCRLYRVWRRICRGRCILRHLGLPDHLDHRRRSGAGPLFARSILRKASAADFAGAVCRDGMLCALRTALDDAGPTEGIRAKRDGDVAVRFEHIFLAQGQLLRVAGRGKAAAPHVEPGGGRAILHILPATGDPVVQKPAGITA